MSFRKTSSKTVQEPKKGGQSLRIAKGQSSSKEGEGIPEIQDSTQDRIGEAEPVSSTEEIEKLRDELLSEREKSSDYLRRLQYLQADFENFRKRTEREMSEVKRYGNDRLLSDLLVVVDELELGLEKARQKSESPVLLEGVGMVLKRVQGLLGKEGVTRIETKGARFDPSIHEAALRTRSSEEEGTIVEEIRSGYTLKGRVLRPSIVKVSEGLARDEKDKGSDNGQYNTEKTLEEEE